ncbi:MAG: hypothetical protein ACOCRX_08255 [Candidatus Woesearchaeota archaeon]
MDIKQIDRVNILCFKTFEEHQQFMILSIFSEEDIINKFLFKFSVKDLKYLSFNANVVSQMKAKDFKAAISRLNKEESYHYFIILSNELNLEKLPRIQ